MRVEASCCRPRIQVHALCLIGVHLLHRNACFVANSVNFGLSLLIVEIAEREYYNDWGSGKKCRETTWKSLTKVSSVWDVCIICPCGNLERLD